MLYRVTVQIAVSAGSEADSERLVMQVLRIKEVIAVLPIKTEVYDE